MISRSAAYGIVATALLSISFPLHGQQSDGDREPTAEELEKILKGPPSHLDDVPAVNFDGSRFRATEGELQEIEKLIERLIEIDEPDYGMAPLMSGHQFAPIASSRTFGSGIIMIDHGLKTHDAVMRLVELGPKAIPSLLAAIDDATPSKLVMDWDGVMGAMWYGQEIALNKANPREVQLSEKHPDVFQHAHRGAGGFDQHIKRHEVTRGDICFTVLGQIVNRRYQATRYQPTSCLVVNSPTHDPEIANVVRDLWQSADPAKMLFDSLMIDLHSRGGAADYQYGAAMRLLYYFSRESAEIISKHIDSFDVRRVDIIDGNWEAWNEQTERNRDARVADFIKAVAFSDAPEVRAAIVRVLERTDDPNLFHECLTPDIAEDHKTMVLRRIGEIVAIPPGEHGPFGGGYHTLMKAAALFPLESRIYFETFLNHGTLNSRRAVIHALKKPQSPIPWAVEFLSPLLDDTTDTKWQYGPDYDRKPIRVCDEAADVLTAHVAGAKFVREGETANLDRQIAIIKRRIAGEPVIEGPVEAIAPIDFDKLPRIAPATVIEIDMQLGRVYPFSNDQTIFAGFGYRANCWAYDTLEIDAKTGAIKSRVKLDEWNGGVNLLDPSTGEHAFCYHNGLVIVRDLRTGTELKRVQTPFHDGVGFDDPLQVRGLGDIFLTHDQKHLIALTPDGSLHAVKIDNAEHKVAWKRPGESRFGHLNGSLVPIEGTNRFIVEFFGEEDPLRIWDCDSGQLSELLKVPTGAWRNAWGPYALNHLNNRLVLWNLDERRIIKVPLPEGAVIVNVACDSVNKRLYAACNGGSAFVIDLVSEKAVKRLEAPQSDGRISLSLSNDGRFCFWQADLTKYERETGNKSNEKTIVAIFALEQ